MNTPSKEALEAAFDLFKKRYCFGSDNDNAAIIDRHFEPLRQRSEQAEARVKELEVSNSELRESHAAIHLALATLEADCSKWPDQIRALRAANAELKKQEAESRRLFYAEQDKRQSAEFRCEELAQALRELLGCPVVVDAATCPNKDVSRIDEAPDWQAVLQISCAWTRYKKLKSVLARHAAGEPAKHPDTELINEFAALCGSLEYCDADDMPSHWRASGYSGSNEGVGRTLRDALRAAIYAARKEVQP